MKRLKIQLGILIIALVGLSAVYGFSRAAGLGWIAQLLALLIGFGAIVLEQRDFALRLRAQGLA